MPARELAIFSIATIQDANYKQRCVTDPDSNESRITKRIEFDNKRMKRAKSACASLYRYSSHDCQQSAFL
jgi:hypothetical protein